MTSQLYDPPRARQSQEKEETIHLNSTSNRPEDWEPTVNEFWTDVRSTAVWVWVLLAVLLVGIALSGYYLYSTRNRQK